MARHLKLPLSGRLVIPHVLLLVSFIVGAVSAYSQGYLYRYVNDDGVTVVASEIPPEFVDNGYEVLGPTGTVVRTVERALTEEEKADRNNERYKKKLAEEEAQRLKEWDESLMIRYSSIEDIEAARDRALSELQIRISILRSNVRSLKAQVQSNQSRAADVERSGGKVPVEIVEIIDALQREIVEAERSITDRLREVEEVRAGFQKDIDRFALLLDKVELRQRYSQTPD